MFFKHAFISPKVGSHVGKQKNASYVAFIVNEASSLDGCMRTKHKEKWLTQSLLSGTMQPLPT